MNAVVKKNKAVRGFLPTTYTVFCGNKILKIFTSEQEAKSFADGYNYSSVKKTYYVMQSFDDDISGEIELTEEEYNIVKRVTNPANWSNVKGDGKYCGEFYISDKLICIC